MKLYGAAAAKGVGEERELDVGCCSVARHQVSGGGGGVDAIGYFIS